MNNRTMATVYVDRDSISLKTRSRNGCSPQQFIIVGQGPVFVKRVFR